MFCPKLLDYEYNTTTDKISEVFVFVHFFIRVAGNETNALTNQPFAVIYVAGMCSKSISTKNTNLTTTRRAIRGIETILLTSTL